MDTINTIGAGHSDLAKETCSFWGHQMPHAVRGGQWSLPAPLDLDG